MQGRSVFGGLTVAAAAGLGLRQIANGWKLRTLNAQLLSPMLPGLVAGSFRVLREGKNVTFIETRLTQAEREVAVVNLVFAKPRETAIQLAAEPPLPQPSPEALSDMPFMENLTPEFTQHIRFRWAGGGLPFSGASEAKTSGYCRFRAPAGDVEGVIGLLDAWPCPSLAMLSSPSPASTVMWTAHFLDAPAIFDDWFAFSYETVAGRDGFHTSVGRLHAADGRLLGWTEQLVVVFG